MNDSSDQVLGLTAQIVSAHVSHNAVTPDALPGLIQEVYHTIQYRPGTGANRKTGARSAG